MSNPASPEGTEELPIEELSIEDLELLARARHQRKRESVPGPVRERLLSRALEEASRSEPSRVVPAGALVVVQPRGWGFALGWVAAVALGVLGVTQVRGWFSGGDGRLAEGTTAGAEGSASSANAAARKLGDRLFQSSIFHAPAESLSKDVSAAGVLPPPEASLFGERPFSAQSRAWQVRRWDDLRTEPAQPAQYELVNGALCVSLGGGERIIGGWPWLDKSLDKGGSEGVVSSGGSVGSGRSESGVVPPVPPVPVPLSAGKAYRLTFKAWAREPLPAQMLIAVGHDRVPFSAAAGARVDVSSTPEAFAVSFVAAHSDPSIGVAFLATGADSSDRTRVCLSDVTLTEAKPH
jgi:hypothetical protein